MLLDKHYIRHEFKNNKVALKTINQISENG